MHHPHGLTTTEWATILTAGFTALAVLAALATAVVAWVTQRDTVRPNVSAGFLKNTAAGAQSIEFVNGGPGLAIALSYFGVDNGQKYGGYVDKGHLLPGASVEVPVPATPEPHAHFVWVCPRRTRSSYVRSYDERTKVVSAREAEKRDDRKLGAWFALMYPKIKIP
jgi:hypothetical protein